MKKIEIMLCGGCPHLHTDHKLAVVHYCQELCREVKPETKPPEDCPLEEA